MSTKRSGAWGGAGVGVAALALVAATAGFRCPGAAPAATSGGLGGGGAGGGTTASESSASVVSSASTTDASSTTDAASSSSTDAASSSSADASSSSSGCVLGDPLNCGECGRVCASTNVLNVSCSAIGTCDSTCLPGFSNLSSPVAPDPDDGCESYPRRVFVSGIVFAPFGGAAGADTKCQMFGEAAFGAGTTWRAWVSDSTTSPLDRFTQSLAPYELVDGTLVANDWTDLTDGVLAHAIDLDENGVLAQGEVWTGTATTGIAAGLDQSCADWTSMGTDTAVVGQSFVSDSGWTNVFQQFCNRDNVRLYCFEQ